MSLSGDTLKYQIGLGAIPENEMKYLLCVPVSDRVFGFFSDLSLNYEYRVFLRG